MSDLSGLYGLAGVIVGATITQGVAWLQKRKRHLSYWSAMSAEVNLCKGLAEAYVRDDKKAPSYRLPTVGYDVGYPALLGDGAVDDEEAMVILRFYLQVAQINRGLEYAHAARDATGPKEVLDGEASRLLIKARALFDPACKDPGGPY